MSATVDACCYVGGWKLAIDSMSVYMLWHTGVHVEIAWGCAGDSVTYLVLFCYGDLYADAGTVHVVDPVSLHALEPSSTDMAPVLTNHTHTKPCTRALVFACMHVHAYMLKPYISTCMQAYSHANR